MVLSLLHISGKGYLEDAARAVRWINTQRNSHGGFVSTQVRVAARSWVGWFVVAQNGDRTIFIRGTGLQCVAMRKWRSGRTIWAATKTGRSHRRLKLWSGGCDEGVS